MEELISVVVPIYNVEKYLNRCIDSILKQTYKNLEIILIDDGSPDNCPQICDEYVKKDNRIQVIHKKNGGLSDARNSGINIAKGKYITFVDSDDLILENSIETLHNNIKQYKKDISVGQIKTFSKENDINEIEKIQEINNVYDTKQAIEKLLYNTEYTSSTAGKLFKTDLFKNIKFPFGKKYEDLATVYKLIFESNGVVVSNKTVYQYFVARQDSIMNEKFSSSRMDALYFTEEILEFVKNKYPDIEISAITRLIIECRDILVEIPKNKEFEDYRKYLNKYIKKYRYKVIFNKKLPNKRRIALLPILFGEKIIKIAWIIKNRIRN